MLAIKILFLVPLTSPLKCGGNFFEKISVLQLIYDIYKVIIHGFNRSLMVKYYQDLK